jgi:hypothetical protein
MTDIELMKKAITFAQIQIRSKSAFNELNELVRLLVKYGVPDEDHELITKVKLLLVKYTLTYSPTDITKQK